MGPPHCACYDAMIHPCEEFVNEEDTCCELCQVRLSKLREYFKREVDSVLTNGIGRGP